MDATYHGREVRNKSEVHRCTGCKRQALADLRQVPVSRHAIGFQGVPGLAQQSSNCRTPACARGARFGICNQVVGIGQSLFDQGQKAQLHGSRIASRVRYQPGAADAVAVDLGQTVNGLTD